MRFSSQIHLINRVDWNIKSYTRRSGDRGRVELQSDSAPCTDVSLSAGDRPATAAGLGLFLKKLRGIFLQNSIGYCFKAVLLQLYYNKPTI